MTFDHLQRGNQLYSEGRPAEAIVAYQAALQEQPGSLHARNNLAAALADLGQHVEAIALFESAVRLEPQFFDAHYNLGNSLRHVGRFEDAVASYRRALCIAPLAAHAHNNIGLALSELGDSRSAIDAFEEAIRIRSSYPEAFTNLGLELMFAGDLKTAVESHTRAIALRPNYAEAYRNRALVRMLLNDFPGAWADYEWRWECNDFTKPILPAPLWQGQPLHGKSIVLYTEQGLGDTLQFVRFCRPLQRMGARVILSAPARLLALLRTCAGIDELRAQGEIISQFDYHCPLVSVPSRLSTTMQDLPVESPYLFADPMLVERWKQVLNSLDLNNKIKVGICWQGCPDIRYDRHRSIPLQHFTDLARNIANHASVQLISLQKGPAQERSVEELRGANIVDLGSELDSASDAFTDTAAVMHSLDLVISADTAMTHVAGALGVPVWVLLPSVPDWRWFMYSDTSPWYPSVRLFRQTEAGDWSSVLKRVQQSIESQLAWPGNSVALCETSRDA